MQKGHQALGTSFHLVMEKVPKGLDWPAREETGASPDEWDKADSLAKIALPLLPMEPPGKAIRRECQITMLTYEGGPTFVGYIDLAIPPGIGWPAFMVPANEAIVGDYKTLSDFRYMKTPEELASSVQMMSYGKWAIQPNGLIAPADPIPEHIRLLHLYARTKPPFTRSSIRYESAVVTPGQIDTFWNKTLDTIKEMQSTTLCNKADDVEANGALNGHCEAYGGCSYRDKCGLAKESNIKTLFTIGKKPTSPFTTETQDMSGSNLIAKIQAARAAQAQAASGVQTQPVAATSTTPSPVLPKGSQQETVKVEGQSQPVQSAEAAKPASPTSTVGPILGLLLKAANALGGHPTLNGVLAQSYAKEAGFALGASGTVPGSGPGSSVVCSTLGELMKAAAQPVQPKATGIVPPDAPPREQPVITQPGQTVADPESDPATSEEGEEGSDTEGDQGAPVTQNDPSVATTTTPVNAEAHGGSDAPKKRGRPSKEEMAAREAQAKAEFDARVEAEVVKRTNTGFGAMERDQLWEGERVKLEKKITQLQQELAKPQATGGHTDQGCTLYVDCYPIRGATEVTDFFTWIQPIAMAVAESNGVKDWRLIDYKGKGLLATHIRELIRAEGLPKAMHIPSYAGGADVALEILTPLAKSVIRKLS